MAPAKIAPLSTLMGQFWDSFKNSVKQRTFNRFDLMKVYQSGIWCLKHVDMIYILICVQNCLTQKIALSQLCPPCPNIAPCEVTMGSLFHVLVEAEVSCLDTMVLWGDHVWGNFWTPFLSALRPPNFAENI